MSGHKNINQICIVITLLAVLFTILFMNGEKLGITPIVDEDAETYEDSVYFTANDQNGDWDESGAVEISLLGDSCKISGNGAYANGDTLVISGGGKYVLSGTWEGSIVVSAYDSSKVFVKLKGVEVSCEDDACFQVDKADKVFLTLAEGTENTFESGENYSDEALQDGTGGAIFAHDDLTINGSGSLTVKAGYKHGIDANDDLILAGGTIQVSAPKDGIHVNDSIRIREAAISIEAQDDGVATAKEGGYLYMESGSLHIESSDDGIHAVSDVTIAGGKLDITAGDDGIHSDTNIAVSDGTISIPACYEGMEAVTIDVSGGEIEIYPKDDGFNANGGTGSMFDMGGGFPGMGGSDAAGSGTEGMQRPDPANMGSGTEGMQRPDFGSMGSGAGGMQPPNFANMGNGTGGMQPPDWNNAGSGTGGMQPPDWNNAGSGAEGMQPPDWNNAGSGAEGMQLPGQNNTENGDGESSVAETEEQETFIRISGGKITIINENAQDADGLDSNGSIYISGGEIYVSLSSGGTNNAIDYGSENGGVCEINGGIVVASGGSGMIEEISDSSTQCSLMYNVSSAAGAGTLVTLVDADGEEVISHEVPCSFSSIVLSTPKLQLGETYTLTMGEQEETVTLDSVAAMLGTASSGMTGGGFGRMNAADGTDRQDSGSGAQTQPDAAGQEGTMAQPDAAGQDGTMAQPDAPVQGSGSESGGLQRPDGSGFAPPDGNGDSALQQGQDRNNGQESEEAEEDDTVTYDSRKEVTAQQWLWLGAAAGVLLLGLLIAAGYKRG